MLTWSQSCSNALPFMRNKYDTKRVMFPKIYYPVTLHLPILLSKISHDLFIVSFDHELHRRARFIYCISMPKHRVLQLFVMCVFAVITKYVITDLFKLSEKGNAIQSSQHRLIGWHAQELRIYLLTQKEFGYRQTVPHRWNQCLQLQPVILLTSTEVRFGRKS